MLSLKSITETLAVLGGSALLVAGCGGATPDASEVPAQPAAADHDAKGASGSCAAGSCGGEGSPTDSAQPTADEPAPGGPGSESGGAAASPPPAPPPDAKGAAASPPPAPPASGAAPKKPPATPPKKPGTAGAPAKKGAQGACGEGTCG